MPPSAALGRLLAAPISLCLTPASLIPGTLLLACAALAVAHVRPAAPYASAAAGLFPAAAVLRDS